MPFEKGKSGNPSGRPKALREVTALARQHTEGAIKTLVDVSENGKSESARVAAAIAIIDRGFGKPIATVQTNPKRSMLDMSDAELLAIATGKDAPDDEDAPEEPGLVN